MAQHSASVTVDAPVAQVYQLFSHFNDYPKFMTYVKEVTYLDDQRSHWVADVGGTHEWDAVNEDWIENRQIGWRSVSGVENSGRVTFESVGEGQTRVAVDVNYSPPAGIIGSVGEALGGGAMFESRLRNDLEHFARMVAEAPAGALDPTSSSYLFHRESAAARGATTKAQDQTMGMSDSDLPADDRSGLAEGTGAAAAHERDTTAIGNEAGGDFGRTSASVMNPSAIVGANTSIGDDALSDPTIPDVPGTTREIR